jgi:hypothetical protein
LLVVFLGELGLDVARAQQPAGPDRSKATEASRVRAEDPVVAMLIREATDRSPTFRRIVDAIQATDGVVYVVPGRCGHAVKACLLLWMAAVGPNRFLRVVLDEPKPGIETMALIAHELRHALEVLAEPAVRTGAGMFDLYRRNGAIRGETFETRAALDAGDAVAREMGRSPSSR